jgi:tRNA G18 (ribose-2'-O)-methylase SpoU
VIGSESHGLSAEARERATETLAIPGAGQTESLNAAIAGSIAMFEIARALQAF